MPVVYCLLWLYIYMLLKGSINIEVILLVNYIETDTDTKWKKNLL